VALCCCLVGVGVLTYRCATAPSASERRSRRERRATRSKLAAARVVGGDDDGDDADAVYNVELGN
jgi:hypothetical protein